MSSAPIKSPPASSPPEKSSAPAGTPDDSSAKLPLSRYVTFFALAITGCAVDLVTKEAMFGWLGIARDFAVENDPQAIARWRGDPDLNHLWWLWDDHFGIRPV